MFQSVHVHDGSHSDAFVFQRGEAERCHSDPPGRVGERILLDSQLYEDLLMEDFYRRLAMLDDEDTYYPQLSEVPAPQPPPPTPRASLWTRAVMERQALRLEHVEHSSNAGSKGFIHMSGEDVPPPHLSLSLCACVG